MSDELRAAAERVVMKHFHEDNSCPLLDVRDPENIRGDVLDVCEAWQADHPADDGEPTDANWLMAVGFSERVDPIIEYFAIPADGQELHLCGGRAYLDCKDAGDWALPGHYRTRGHVRRLCAALGITLTEKP